MVEFEIFIKENDGYRKKIVIQPSGAGWEFIESLRKTVEQEIEHTREDIAKLFPEDIDINLKRPVVDDTEVQEKINKLVEIRRQNIKTKEQLIQILTYDDYIICENCKGKMYKIPIGVKYIKFGNKYLVQDLCAGETIKYIYGCESCNSCIDAEIHNKKEDLKKLKVQLIKEGESFVPNEYGFWHWENNNKTSKPEYMEEERKECRHIFRREFETIKVPGQKQPFVKIIEKCIYCGFINFSK